MTPEQQRIKIAEACGWDCIVVEGVQIPSGDIHALPTGFSPYGCRTESSGQHTGYGSDGDRFVIPDYLNNLNAMHEAEGVLTDKQHGSFRARLAVITTGRVDTSTRLMSTVEYRAWFCAIASQRAEAFLRTLGLWE